MKIDKIADATLVDTTTGEHVINFKNGSSIEILTESCDTHRSHKKIFYWDMKENTKIDESDMEEAEELLQEVMADE